MPYDVAVLFLLCSWMPCLAAKLDVSTSIVALPLITQGPVITGEELRKRDDRSTNCGYSNGWIWTCNKPSFCAATVLTNGQAFQYCGISGAVNQPFYTAAYSHWSPNKRCPTSASCCSSPWPEVITQLYIADGYTVTGWECNDNKPVTNTIVPDKNVLNPSKFKASLANLVQSTSTSHSSGTSSDTTVGIGVGVGVGLAIVLIGALAFFLWRRRDKKKWEQLAKLPDSEEVVKDRCQYCHQGLPSQQKSDMVEAECPLTEMDAGYRAEMD